MPNAHRWVRGRPSKFFTYGSSPSSSMTSLNSLSLPTSRPIRPRPLSQLSSACPNSDQPMASPNHTDTKKLGKSFLTPFRFGSTFTIASLFAFALLIFVALISRNIDLAITPSQLSGSTTTNGRLHSSRLDDALSSNSLSSSSSLSSTSNVHNHDPVISKTLITSASTSTPSSASPVSSALTNTDTTMNLSKLNEVDDDNIVGTGVDKVKEPINAVGNGDGDKRNINDVDINNVAQDSSREGNDRDVNLKENQRINAIIDDGPDDDVHDGVVSQSKIPTNSSTPITEESTTPSYGAVGWTRSWPSTRAFDRTGLHALQEALKFDNTTLLNYFHLHKTGGVFIKATLLALFSREENLQKLSKNGRPLRVTETCYQASVPPWKLNKVDANWRCDFIQIRQLPPQQLQSIDLVIGHQYWQNGSDHYFGPFRDVRYFSVFRHPLPRKLSFYYHFFVRNEGRNESEVERAEIMKFLSGVDLPGDPRMRDGGPNYYATRFLSTGLNLFDDKNQFHPAKEEEDGIIDTVTGYVNQKFAFAGLQAQSLATDCMLEKLIQLFGHAHGIDDLIGTQALTDKERARLNSGRYPWTAKRLWNSMSREEKEQFRRVERVDLAIYQAVVQKFRRDVEIFSCSDEIDEQSWEEDRFD